MKKYEVIIIITAIIMILELVYVLTPNLPFTYSQRMFSIFLVIAEFFALREIWFRKRSQYLEESQFTWPLENEEKEW